MSILPAPTEPGRIRLPEKLGFGAYSLSLDCCNNFVATFLLFFYTDVLGITPALAGVVSLIASVWDGVNDPIFGYVAANRRFKNREIARPYLKWFAIPTAVMFMLIFLKVDLPRSILFIYAVVVYLIYDTFNTFNRIPAGSMVTLATNRQDDRISISLFTAAGSSIGVIIATLGCWPLIYALSGVSETGLLINPRRGFLAGSLLVGLVLVAGSLLHYRTTKERILPEPDAEQKVGLLESLRILFGCRIWVENTLFYLFYNFSIIFMTGTLTYYATRVLGDPGAATIILAAYIFSSLIAIVLFVGRLHKKLGRRKTMILSAVLMIASKIYFTFFPASVVAAIVMGVLVGISVAFAINVNSLNVAESADYIAWKNDKHLETMIATFNNTVSKLGVALCNFFIGLLLEFTGYNADLAVQPESAIKGIEACMGVIPMVMAVFMLLIALKSKIEPLVAEMKAATKKEDA
ncbi:MAG: glycoside-pentoside-hexuronide (GPH):cation symporter [Clostridia bacterium]|nr:glycoside-pentoside-hexuronide (GPH):cation symporter [Clostridia bacterium]